MDRKTLVKKLNNVFCNINKVQKKYAEVWLSEADMGGMYNTGCYNMYVRSTHNLQSCNDEIKSILYMLNDQAKEELKYILSVRVYNSSKEIHCPTEDIPVFEADEAC